MTDTVRVGHIAWCRCACGGILVASYAYTMDGEPTAAVQGAVIRHQQTDQHKAYALAVELLDPWRARKAA